MATRVPSTNQNGQAGVRNRGANDGAVDDWSVSGSMKEFWLWVIIVTLLLFLAMMLGFGVVYNAKQIKKTEAMLLRLEEKERRNEKPRVDPKPDSPDGL